VEDCVPNQNHCRGNFDEQRSKPKNRRYTFVINTAISMYTEVIAETLEEAVKKARDRSIQSLCYECASEGTDKLGRREWRIGGEIDADPASSDLVICS